MKIKIITTVDIDTTDLDEKFIDVKGFAIEEAKRIMAEEPEFFDFNYELEEEAKNSIKIPVLNGILKATLSSDPNYPGIWVEYLDREDKGKKLSRPSILMEAPENQELRCIAWTDPDNEDYTAEIKF